MSRILRIAVGAALFATACIVAVTAEPAGATVTFLSVGTRLDATVTGNTTVSFACSSGKLKVASAVSTMPCSTVNEVDVIGDASSQIVLGDELNAAVFAAHPHLEVTLGAGHDTATGTARADSFTMGGDADTVTISATSAADTLVDLGGGNDTLDVVGTALADTITATSTNANGKVGVTNSGGTRTTNATSIENLTLEGGNGNDTLTSAGVSNASNIDRVELDGDLGNDTLTAGPTGSYEYGGNGSNVFDGGTGPDQFTTTSDTDVIHRHTSGSDDQIIDSANPRSGGRTIDGQTFSSYTQIDTGCDAQVRLRPGTSTGHVVTSALCRPGIATLDPFVDPITVDLATGETTDNRGLVDVDITGRIGFVVHGDAQQDDLVDVTISTGSWTTSGSVPGSITVTPTTPLLGVVAATSIGAISIHNPWTNANQGFAHRVIRDLEFRFPGAAERDAIRDSLANHTKTRPQVISSLMDTDLYRGLDVDRVFVKFLHRTADPSGRTFWINGLRNGKGLRKFRAQLFGGNEYFTKAGGTNAAFVDHAYADVLGRLPDPSGRAYWLHKLNTGTERGLVANAFLSSTDARRQIVKDEFLRFVLRFPTTAEEDQWIPTLQEVQGEPTLIAFLAASGAYYANP